MDGIKQEKVAVIGAGPMGLMCAYELLKKGYTVNLFERDDRIGGMTATFDFAGTQIERFYHFICKTDAPYFDLLKELNLLQHLKWRDTHMGFYFDNQLYPWGSPIHLLKFPKLEWSIKLRYALMAWSTCRIQDWNALDKVGVTDWLVKWLGKKGYDKLWKNLFYYKFYQHKDDLSAAWLGTRIKRVGKSRRSIFQESLGYLQGGSNIFLNAMEEKIKQLGGEIFLKSSVKQVTSTNGIVDGVNVDDQVIPFDKVVSTIPLPFIPAIIPQLSEQTKNQIKAIQNVGVACVLFKMKKPFSPYFWMNINDNRIEIPGIIEYSNLNPADESILYVPYYMPHDHHKYKWSDEQFIAECLNYFKLIRPDFDESLISAKCVTRYGFAQTVCPTHFYEKLPPMVSEIKNLFMADTAYYYPEDRSISESVRIGEQLADLVMQKTSYAT